jgi:diketogulonate reductase-like aldo/keto reductase
MWTPVVSPIHKFERTVEGLFDQTNNGLVDTISVLNFSLNDLPNFAEFTALYDMYKIARVEIEFTPEYTELTDAALVSNAINVFFNSAVDPAGIGITVLNDILQFKTLASTPITKNHKRTLVPATLMGGLTPCSCWITTTSTATNLFGLDIAIQACGVAMTFRSRAKYFLEFSCSR